MTCPRCGIEMNHHADKLVERVDEPGEWHDPFLGGVIHAVHTCPACGSVESRPTSVRTPSSEDLR
jgi:ribosomal protein S27AE